MSQLNQKIWQAQLEAAMRHQRELYEQTKRNISERAIKIKQCSDPHKGQNVDIMC